LKKIIVFVLGTIWKACIFGAGMLSLFQSPLKSDNTCHIYISNLYLNNLLLYFYLHCHHCLYNLFLQF
jgi:hypothetical protein